MRPHILAQLLRQVVGPHLANACEACDQLNTYSHADGKAVVELWQNEIERVFGKRAIEVADSWGRLIDRDFKLRKKTKKQFVDFLFGP